MGKLPLAKVDSLSGFNTDRIYHIFHRHYQDHFGFTEAEVKALVKDSNLNMSAMKRYYSSYHIGDVDVYNPFSVTEAIRERDITSYWTQSGILVLTYE